MYIMLYFNVILKIYDYKDIFKKNPIIVLYIITYIIILLI